MVRVRSSKHSEHRALALLRSEKYPHSKGAPCAIDLTKQIRETHLWTHQWRIKSGTDHDVWCYITMRWPILSQEDKQRIFKAVMERSYQTYNAPVDRFIIVNKANMRKNI